MEKSILRDFWKDMQSIWSRASLFSTDKSSEHHQLLHHNAKNPLVQDTEHASLAGGRLCFGSHSCAFHLRLFKCGKSVPARKEISQILMSDKATERGHLVRVAIEEYIKRNRSTKNENGLIVYLSFVIHLI